jgi:HSP20 family protein
MATATAIKKPESQEAATSAERSMQPSGDGPFFLSRMRDEFDRLLHRFTHNLPTMWEMGGSTWRWGVDMEEKDDALVVKAEAPGFEANDFDVHVEDHRLVLRASRKTESTGKNGKSVEQQEFYQSVTLPTDINKDMVEASYHSGVLTVTMPKTAAAKGKKITVQGK